MALWRFQSPVPALLTKMSPVIVPLKLVFAVVAIVAWLAEVLPTVPPRSSVWPPPFAL